MDPEWPIPFAGDSSLLGEIDAAGLDAFAAAVQPPLMVGELRHLGGALSRVADGAGALGSLHGEYVLLGGGVVGDSSSEIDAALVRLRAATAAYETGALYPNFTERPADSSCFFTEADYARLQRIRVSLRSTRIDRRQPSDHVEVGPTPGSSTDSPNDKEQRMNDKPHIVLVHGFWGGAAHWAKVIVELDRRGYDSLHAVENPLTSLADDADRTRQMVRQVDGPVLLVGHSYGGAVITEAGDLPNVVGLVYVAAFAPDAGESLAEIGAWNAAAAVGKRRARLGRACLDHARTSSARASARTCPPTRRW